MRRIVVSAIAVLVAALVLGYVGGVLTGEERREDSCLLCRAVRYSGRHYGFGYERVEDTVMTDWYRSNIDPLHGLDPGHPHTWQQSASTVTVGPGGREQGADAVLVAPVFLLRPEIERAALQQVPDKATQVGLIQSLSAADRAEAMRRVQLLIEYFYVYQPRQTWAEWWRQHSQQFGLQVIAAE